MTRNISIPRALILTSMSSYMAGNAVAVYGEYIGKQAESMEVTRQYLIHGYAPLQVVAGITLIAAGLYYKYRTLRNIPAAQEAETQERSIDRILE
jgi:hypothetical protein